MRKARGSLSAFVVSMAAASMVLVGFVHDTGRELARYLAVADAAQNAARIGAQSIRDIRSGDPRIDVDRATGEARRYLSGLGHQGAVSADHQTVTVIIETSIGPTMLSTLGLGSKRIRVTRSALVIGG